MITPAESLPMIRAALAWVGGSVAERPMPRVEAAASGYYVPATHTVHLPTAASRHTLLHELAHSQQADLSAPTYYHGGRIDARAWMDDPREQEAEAVAELVPLMERPDWQQLRAAVEAVGAVGVARVHVAAQIVRDGTAGADWHRIASAVAAAGIAEDAPEWCLWMARGDIRAPKPARLSRRPRLQVNAQLRALSAR